MTIEIEGEYNTATLYGDESLFDEATFDQIQGIVDHEAFEGESDIKIMPDAHYGAGAVIGFTMPVKDKVVPNTIGLDIGCGMYAVNFGNISIDNVEKLDKEVRKRVPMGFEVHSRNRYHMKDDFPWSECARKIETFNEQTHFDVPVPEYDIEWFEEKCKEVEYDVGRAINSLGTLGGGNHFIEFARDDSANVWCIIHSGSRGIGGSIAQYWQDTATEKMFEKRNLVKIPSDEVKYFEIAEGLQNDGEEVYCKPSSLSIDREAILEDYEGEAIEGKFGQLKSYMNAGKDDSSPLDYLEGEEAHGYIQDMVFAQTYASESRKEMMRHVKEAIAEVESRNVGYTDTIESIHNYIDFEDGTMRKGACKATAGKRIVIPYNMGDGTIIATAAGRPSWNESAPHGAGRRMSRTEAKNRFDEGDVDEQIGDVYMSEKPIDEAPSAYKDASLVEDALVSTATIDARLKPFLSMKAD